MAQRFTGNSGVSQFVAFDKAIVGIGDLAAFIFLNIAAFGTDPVRRARRAGL